MRTVGVSLVGGVWVPCCVASCEAPLVAAGEPTPMSGRPLGMPGSVDAVPSVGICCFQDRRPNEVAPADLSAG